MAALLGGLGSGAGRRARGMGGRGRLGRPGAGGPRWGSGPRPGPPPAARALAAPTTERGRQPREALDPRLAEVVEFRFYAGMEFEEIARQLGVTERTVYRDWRKARAFMLAHLGEAA